MEQLVLNVAAAVLFVVLSVWALVLVSMPAPRRGDWSSSTYGPDEAAADLGPDYSALDVRDHLPNKYRP